MSQSGVVNTDFRTVRLDEYLAKPFHHTAFPSLGVVNFACRAALLGNEDLLRDIIQASRSPLSYVTPNEKDIDPLRIVIAKQHLGMLDALLNAEGIYDSVLQKAGPNGENAIHLAARASQPVIKRMLEYLSTHEDAKEAIFDKDNSGRSALDCIILGGHAKLLANDPDFFEEIVKDEYGPVVALAMGLTKGYVALDAENIMQKAGPEDQNALHFAASVGNVKFLSLVAETIGDDVLYAMQVSDKSDLTPLQLAAFSKESGFVESVLNYAGDTRMTLLTQTSQASITYHVEIVGTCFTYRTNNVPRIWEGVILNSTLLHFAVFSNNPESVHAVFQGLSAEEAMFLISSRDHGGFTPLDYACEYATIQLVQEMLIATEGQVCSLFKNHNTQGNVLHHALYAGSRLNAQCDNASLKAAEMIQFLLTNAGDSLDGMLSGTNIFGTTATQLAAVRGCVDVLEVLLHHDPIKAFDLIMEKNSQGNGAIAFAVKYSQPNALGPIFDFAIEYFSPEECQQILLHVDKRYCTALGNSLRMKGNIIRQDGTSVSTKREELLQKFHEFISSLVEKFDFNADTFLDKVLLAESCYEPTDKECALYDNSPINTLRHNIEIMQDWSIVSKKQQIQVAHDIKTLERALEEKELGQNISILFDPEPLEEDINDDDVAIMGAPPSNYGSDSDPDSDF